MKRPALVFLIVVAVAPQVFAECTPVNWFIATAIVDCPIDSPNDDVFIRFSGDYIPSPAPSPDPGRSHFETLNGKSGDISLVVVPLSSDMKEHQVPQGEILVNRGGITASFPRSEVGSFRLVLPAGSLFCEGTLVNEEVVVEFQPTNDCTDNNAASSPLDWRIDLAPADDDAEDDAGLAIEFGLEKEWGYGFKRDLARQRWSSNLWRLKIDGSGATNDTDFYDAVTADLSWAYNRTYVVDAARNSGFPIIWGSVYFRPEATFSDDRDYVYGGRLEVISNLRKLIGTDVGTGTRPYLSLGIEQVDTDRREDGTVPDNYERLAGDLLWKFSPQDRLRVEASWEAKYILSRDDLDALGLDDRLQDKLEVSIAYDATGSGEFLPFLKYTRGTESPGFELVDEVLVGFAWDFLFQGERP